ncbi:MAG TPA: flagellar export chaperone FlgN [Pirellulales bacterium]|jgi:flagellar biosynthesis/type III secretory pathway chaperone
MPDLSVEADDFDSQLARLLTELSEAQQELLAVISEKRMKLMTADLAGLAEMAPREEALINRLQSCQQQRSAMLAEADAQGRPHRSLAELATSLPAPQRQHWEPQIRDASHRCRLLQHQSLTNWLLVQRTVLHLSQILEIIATGGRIRPTYGKGATADTSGNLVDQEA